MDSDAFDGLKRTFGMQHEGQDKVDPYVVVSFAGKKLKTHATIQDGLYIGDQLSLDADYRKPDSR